MRESESRMTLQGDETISAVETKEASARSADFSLSSVSLLGTPAREPVPISLKAGLRTDRS